MEVKLRQQESRPPTEKKDPATLADDFAQAHESSPVFFKDNEYMQVA